MTFNIPTRRSYLLFLRAQNRAKDNTYLYKIFHFFPSLGYLFVIQVILVIDIVRVGISF